MNLGTNILDAVRNPVLREFYARVLSTPIDQRIGLIKAESERAGREFELKVKAFEQRLLGFSPFHTLARFCFYDLAYLPEKRKKLITNDPIELYHIEFLQALLLAHTETEFDRKAPSAKEFQLIRDSLRELTTVFTVKGFGKVQEDPSQHLKESLLSTIRSHTSFVRGWGHEREMFSALRSLFEPIDGKVRDKLGFSILGVITMFIRLAETAERRRQLHFKKMKKLMTSRSIEAAINAFGEICPFSEHFLVAKRFVEASQLSLRETKQYLWECSDQFLLELFAFSTFELTDASQGKLTCSETELVAQRLSHRLGDLRENKREYFFSDNPVWRKPFLEVASGIWWMPNSSSFHAFCFEITADLVSADETLKGVVHQRRGTFLEETIAEKFRAKFPKRPLFCGNLYKEDSGAEIENDFLTVFDSIALIIEAKSGQVNRIARRGGSSLQTEIQQLVVDPSFQSLRFAAFLKAHPEVHRFRKKKGGANEVDIRNVHHFLAFTVTLERLGPLAVQLNLLQQAGLIRAEAQLVPSLSLPDFDVLLHLLDSEFEFLHYLTRRFAFCAKHDVFADEMDLLVFYLQTGFVDLMEEQRHHAVSMYGLSSQIDHYFQFRGTKHAVKKPKRKMGKWWKDILNTLERRDLHRRYELGCLFLDVPVEQQNSYEREVKAHCRRFKRLGNVAAADLLSVTMVIVSDVTSTAFLTISLKEDNYTERKTIVERFAINALDSLPINQVVVVLLDTDAGHWPYSGIYLLDRPEANDAKIDAGEDK